MLLSWLLRVDCVNFERPEANRIRVSKLAEEEYKPTQGMTYFDVVKEDAV